MKLSPVELQPPSSEKGYSHGYEEIRRMAGDKGVDVAIEALGTQATFESGLRVFRAGEILSSLEVDLSNVYIQLPITNSDNQC